MIRALSKIDAIIKIMKTSEDTNQARDLLMADKFGFSSEQAEAIMSLTLRRLTAMEETKLKAEHEDLSSQIKSLRLLMDEDNEVYKLLKKETRALKAKHAVPRRTKIVDDAAELSEVDLLANEGSVIIITRSGYIKRMPILEFEAQSRGGKGKAGARLSTAEDSVAHFFSCNDHDTLIFTTNRGIAYSIRAYQVPLGARTAKGVPLPQVLPISQEERVTTVLPVDSFKDEEEHLVLLTKRGFVKKTPLKAFETISQRGLVIISLEEGDSLSWARRCLPHEEILIATRNGFASRFTAADLRSSGRKSRGVRALNLRAGDSMADMDIMRAAVVSAGDKSKSSTSSSTSTTDQGKGKSGGTENGASYVLAVTEQGYGKRISIDEFRTQKRGGKGVIIIKFKSKSKSNSKKQQEKEEEIQEEEEDDCGDALSCMRVCAPGDEVVISTSRGTVIRQKVDDISLQSRAATGVLLQSLSPVDSVVTVDLVPPALD